jgi:hypothetical protein
MVQLSVLLCLIPLALENAMMQAHVTQVGWVGAPWAGRGGAGRGGAGRGSVGGQHRHMTGCACSVTSIWCACA